MLNSFLKSSYCCFACSSQDVCFRNFPSCLATYLNTPKFLVHGLRMAYCFLNATHVKEGGNILTQICLVSSPIYCAWVGHNLPIWFDPKSSKKSSLRLG
jgi:hypothetical protein